MTPTTSSGLPIPFRCLPVDPHRPASFRFISEPFRGLPMASYASDTSASDPEPPKISLFGHLLLFSVFPYILFAPFVPLPFPMLRNPFRASPGASFPPPFCLSPLVLRLLIPFHRSSAFPSFWLVISYLPPVYKLLSVDRVLQSKINLCQPFSSAP